MYKARRSTPGVHVAPDYVDGPDGFSVQCYGALALAEHLNALSSECAEHKGNAMSAEYREAELRKVLDEQSSEGDLLRKLVIQAIGWTWADACAKTLAGLDIGKHEIPELLERIQRDIPEMSVLFVSEGQSKCDHEMVTTGSGTYCMKPDCDVNWL